MAYPQHWLFVMGGKLTNLSPVEIWECTVRGLPAAGADFTFGQEDAALQAISGALATWFADPANRLSTAASLEYIKLNEIGPDGRYANPSESHQFDYASPSHGGISPTMPSILTLAWSWKTARARGVGSNGRIYPPVALPSTATDRLTSADVALHVAAAQKFLQVLANPSTGTFVLAPCVVSKGANDGTGVGVVADITSVRVGDVIDVQRRRKSALAEAYQSLPFPPG